MVIGFKPAHCGFATRAFVTLVVKRGSILVLFYCLKAHPTAVGGLYFFLLLIQKQVTHGTQSMGFKTNT